MPTLSIGKVRYVWKGTWSATASYDILDRVQDSDGFIYESIKAVPAGTVLTNTSYWIKLSVQGPRGLKGDIGNDGPKGDPGEAPTLFCTRSRTILQTLSGRKLEQTSAGPRRSPRLLLLR